VNEKHACSAFNRSAFENPHSGVAYIHWGIFLMPPDTFLRLAVFLGGDLRPEAHRAFSADGRFKVLPFLKLKDISSDCGVVRNHEGRHRSTVLRENGYETVPVVIYLQRHGADKTPWPQFIQAQSRAEDPEFMAPLPPRLDPAQWPDP